MGVDLVVTDAEDMLATALEILQEMGHTASLVSVTATYGSGATTETTAAETVACYLSETQGYTAGDTSQRATGTLYVAASGLTATPKVSDRLTIDSRSWAVLGVQPIHWAGTDVLYQLEVAELGE